MPSEDAILSDVPSGAVDVHIGRTLRRLREARGVATGTLAKEAACQPDTIVDLEAGRRPATAHEIYWLSRALGVKMATLFAYGDGAST